MNIIRRVIPCYKYHITDFQGLVTPILGFDHNFNPTTKIANIITTGLELKTFNNIVSIAQEDHKILRLSLEEEPDSENTPCEIEPSAFSES